VAIRPTREGPRNAVATLSQSKETEVVSRSGDAVFGEAATRTIICGSIIATLHHADAADDACGPARFNTLPGHGKLRATFVSLPRWSSRAHPAAIWCAERHFRDVGTGKSLQTARHILRLQIWSAEIPRTTSIDQASATPTPIHLPKKGANPVGDKQFRPRVWAASRRPFGVTSVALSRQQIGGYVGKPTRLLRRVACRRQRKKGTYHEKISQDGTARAHALSRSPRCICLVGYHRDNVGKPRSREHGHRNDVS
jgi:hypothetical protein